MSIIRQRRKNLIISGLLGFLLAALLLTVLAYFYRQPLAEWAGIAPVMTVTLPEKVPVLAAAKPIAKGTVLAEDHLTTIYVEVGSEVVSPFSEPSQLLGKTTALDIDRHLPFTEPMFFRETLMDRDLRLYEVSFVELPYHLQPGDIVDIRIAFPTGQEYVVLAKKEVMAFERQTDSVHKGLLSLSLEETEALKMSSALVDLFIAEGTRVYLVKYVSPEQQPPAVVNYPVNEHVLALLRDNPNILETPDLLADVQSREMLKAALSTIIDENNELRYQVDMATPGASYELTLGMEGETSDSDDKGGADTNETRYPKDTDQSSVETLISSGNIPGESTQPGENKEMTDKEETGGIGF